MQKKQTHRLEIVAAAIAKEDVMRICPRAFEIWNDCKDEWMSIPKTDVNAYAIGRKWHDKAFDRLCNSFYRETGLELTKGGGVWYVDGFMCYEQPKRGKN